MRSSSILPLIGGAGVPVRVTFSIHDEWTAVTPWSKEEEWFRLLPHELRDVEYIGVGPYQVSEYAVQGHTIRVGRAVGAGGVGSNDIAAALRYFQESVGVPPPAQARIRSVLLVPPAFMRGGAAGARSVVQPPNSPFVLVHELIHWWLHSGLTAPEARWVVEGITNFYAIRTARETALATEAEATACLADLQAEMRFLERDRPMSLAEASNRYATDSVARRLVYAKGTLFAWHLDRELSAVGHTLDEWVGEILEHPRSGLDNNALRRLMVDAYGREMGALFDAYVLRATRLQETDMAGGNGRSGCALFLPQR